MTKTKHLKIALLATVATLATLLSAGAASAAVPFGIESVSGWLRAPDGTPLHAAGAHAAVENGAVGKVLIDVTP